MRFTKHESDVKCEENLLTKLEMKNRGTDYHFFQEVHVSRLDVLVSYKVEALCRSALEQGLLGRICTHTHTLSRGRMLVGICEILPI
jgi:hypothetical protein